MLLFFLVNLLLPHGRLGLQLRCLQFVVCRTHELSTAMGALCRLFPHLCPMFGPVQALRHPDCQEECALCADTTTPCQNCLEEKPVIIKCDDPSSKIVYDPVHFTTQFHLVFGEAVRQCSKDQPNYGRPWVEVLCPPGEAGEEV